jgi:DNA-binding beta-propeller fold protein YncE
MKMSLRGAIATKQSPTSIHYMLRKLNIASIFVLFISNSGSALAPSDDYIIKLVFAFPGPEPINSLPLAQPQALAIDPEGQVFVVDTGNHRVLKFDHAGNFVSAIGGFGWSREQFDRPLDITAKTGLDVFIADYNNERIERYDTKLNYISSFYSDAAVSATLQFGFPGGVDISRHGELFICDREHDRILKLNIRGEPDLSFGDFNTGEGQLQLPAKIEISLNDFVYVSDQTANEIVVFDYYGNYLSRFGKEVLNQPNGLTWSADGKLYIADSGNHRVVVFNKEQQLIFSWGERGEKIGAFNQPLDVAVFKNQIYVLDSGNRRIQVFELQEKANSAIKTEGH